MKRTIRGRCAHLMLTDEQKNEVRATGKRPSGSSHQKGMSLL